MLHPYSRDSLSEDTYFGFSAIVDTKGFLYAYPDGTKDKQGNRFWNADDACCNVNKSNVDDVAYLAAVIDDVSAQYNVDPNRIFVVGHSNGAFMAHRLACDLAPKIAAIVALAGDVWLDGSKCKPAVPVSVLQIHGDADMTVSYNGGSLPGFPPYPSAKQSVATWAMANGCSGMLVDTGKTFDLVTTLPGAETSEAAYTCPAGSAALWTMQGADHIPSLQPTFASLVYDYVAAHPKQ
jgi:polyhydroxybutyrate depolymerase